MNKITNNELLRAVAENLSNWLKRECGEGWHITKGNDTLTGTYLDSEFFKLERDVHQWYLDCNNMPLDIVQKIYEIATETEKKLKLSQNKTKSMNPHDCIHEIMQQLDYDPVREILDTPPDELTVPTPEDFEMQ